jgi:hypothetical protein
MLISNTGETAWQSHPRCDAPQAGKQAHRGSTIPNPTGLESGRGTEFCLRTRRLLTEIGGQKIGPALFTRFGTHAAFCAATGGHVAIARFPEESAVMSQSADTPRGCFAPFWREEEFAPRRHEATKRKDAMRRWPVTLGGIAKRRHSTTAEPAPCCPSTCPDPVSPVSRIARSPACPLNTCSTFSCLTSFTRYVLLPFTGMTSCLNRADSSLTPPHDLRHPRSVFL